MSKISRIPKSFLGFVAISMLIWLLINLAKEYETTIDYEVSYKDIPIHQTLIQKPKEQVKILVKGSGFDLFSTSFKSQKLVLSFNDFNKKSTTEYFYLPNKELIKLQKQLHSGIKFKQFYKDSIKIRVGTLQSKKVPIKPQVSLQYKVGFNKVGAMVTKPDSILVTGTSTALRDIKFFETEPLEFDNVSEDIQTKSKIIFPKNSELKFSHTQVQIFVNVDTFTEGVFEIPVQVQNVPKGTKLNIYPKKIQAVYTVGLKNFSAISQKSFVVTCDYKYSKENELPYLVPKLVQKPKEVLSVRLEPQKIDFLIHQ